MFCQNISKAVPKRPTVKTFFYFMLLTAIIKFIN
jgi:hypothetical protein